MTDTMVVTQAESDGISNESILEMQNSLQLGIVTWH